MTEPDPLPTQHQTPRQIIGFSLAPDLAAAVRAEAARRGLSLKALFEEMWQLYRSRSPDPLA